MSDREPLRLDSVGKRLIARRQQSASVVPAR